MTRLSIFYDLETTSLNPTGQILNFCFIAVDGKWAQQKRLAGLVKVSQLQLPEPGAIGATNIDILKHQREASLTEREAVLLIRSFLEDCKGMNGGELPLLIGQNSADFDLDFLRTTFIRNGNSPYGLFEPKDLLLLSRFLFATNDTFRKRVPPVMRKEKEKLTLSLQHLSQSFGLLQGEQLHESAFDVELSIDLARFYEREFHIDVRTFDNYGLRRCHLPETTPVRVSEFKQSLTQPMKLSWKLFLKEEGNAALWVDLDKFGDIEISRAEAIKAVKRYKIHGHLAWPGPNEVPSLEVKEAAHRARNILGHVTASELFGASTCYIEQFIYRIAPNEHNLLFRALEKSPSVSADLSADIVILTRRYWLENCPECERGTEEYQKAFRDYALYRYGGKLLLKNVREGETPNEKCYHPTLKQLLAEIRKAKEDPVKRNIFESLEHFYLESEVVKVAGKELLDG